MNLLKGLLNPSISTRYIQMKKVEPWPLPARFNDDIDDWQLQRYDHWLASLPTFPEWKRKWIENEEISGLPSELDLVSSLTRETTRCLCLKGGRLPMESAGFYKHYLPIACGKFLRSILNIFLQHIPSNEKYCLEEDLGINQYISERHSIVNRVWKYPFLLCYPKNRQNNFWAASRLLHDWYFQRMR